MLKKILKAVLKEAVNKPKKRYHHSSSDYKYKQKHSHLGHHYYKKGYKKKFFSS
ncbi:hypothetical protein [Ferdinandcohnia sp. Marseille-Q9671]